MCGIVGYIGSRKAYPILIKGLKRLEYRGYDSAGIALLDESKSLKIFKKKGKVSNLEDFADNENHEGSIGIAHTRWATHGEPSDINAHPHSDESSNIAVVHNGIIENYAHLKEELISKGHKFVSQTDTEVLAHLVEDFYKNGEVKLEEAVRKSLEKVTGTYGILVFSKTEPDKIIAARKGSPLVIGVGNNEYFLASDAVPIAEYTKSVIYLNDGDIAVIKENELKLKNMKDELQEAIVKEIEFETEALEKLGYEHFMLKEIYEQSEAVKNSLRGRIEESSEFVTLGGLSDVKDKLLNAKRIVIVACGTSWHAGLIAEYWIENLTRIPVEVEYASEYRYKNPIITSEDVIIAISQSGETADTLEAIRLGKAHGATVLGVVNVVGSTISRETDAGIYTHAGPEIGVASTKAFTTQLSAFAMLALWIYQNQSNHDKKVFEEFRESLIKLPEFIKQTLEVDKQVIEIAEKFKDSRDALYIGRGVNYPIALEGALKLKEISYIHAEGYASGEMKHGPIALIDESMPVVCLATRDAWREKNLSNMQEVKARKGQIIAIANPGDEEVKKVADHIIEVPEFHPLLSPIINTIPIQLLAYHIAVMRGCNVDQPRNLAKSVTVE